MRKGFSLVLAGVLLAMAGGARADHALLHACGEKAAIVRFPAGFPTLIDSECGFPIGGFGGALPDDANWNALGDPEAPRRAPVIMVHGNVVDHADWYPVRDELIRRGWHPDDLWALSYNGLGNASGSGATPNPRRDDEHAAADSDGMARNTTNTINVTDVCAFIEAVRAHTGSDRFHLVTHSLGVTLARRALETCRDASDALVRDDLVSFIAIAGANHGTSLCPPGSETLLSSCDEIASDTPWLNALNAAPDEFGTAQVLAIYDGTGVSDVAFVGPTYARSPRLDDVAPWSINCAYGRGHNDLRMSPTLIPVFDAFMRAAEADTTGGCGPDALPL